MKAVKKRCQIDANGIKTRRRGNEKVAKGKNGDSNGNEKAARSGGAEAKAKLLFFYGA